MIQGLRLTSLASNYTQLVAKCIFHALPATENDKRSKIKTYNSRYSLVVTHPTTNLPIYSLYMGERTGSLVLCSLWSYVEAFVLFKYILCKNLAHIVGGSTLIKGDSLNCMASNLPRTSNNMSSNVLLPT